MARRTLQRTQRSIPPRFRGSNSDGNSSGNFGQRSSSRSSSSHPTERRSERAHDRQTGHFQDNAHYPHPQHPAHFQEPSPPQRSSQRSSSRMSSGIAPRSKSASRQSPVPSRKTLPQGSSKAAPNRTPKTISRSEPKAPSPVSSKLPSTDVHSIFAAFDNERIYLTGAPGVFAQERTEQALMRHLGMEDNLSLSPILTTLGELLDREQKIDADEDDADVQTEQMDVPSAKPSLKRTAASRQEESEETRSPFGDVISSVEEIIRAKNGGRYMPQPRIRPQSENFEREKPERDTSNTPQRRIALHPATTLRYYTSPHKHIHNEQHKHRNKNRNNRTQTEFPAAIPKENVFGIMPSETKPFYTQMQHALSHEALLPRGATLIAAVSGGVDSISMLDMLVKLQEVHKYKVFVVHFNHHLRGRESEQDEFFVRETAKRYGLACYVASADIGLVARREKMSIEHAARELRYNALEFLAKKLGADAVCTAHTLNDSVETMLLNLIRGTGLTGLAGIPAERPLIFGKVIRPLLRVKKAELLRYAELRKLLWREDSSNELTMFTRNKIRHNLLPMLESEYSEGIVEVLHRTAEIVSGADTLVRETVERLFAYVLVPDEGQSYIGLRVVPLKVQTPFLQAEIVRRAMQKRFHATLSHQAVERILSLLEMQTGAKVDISHKYFAVRDRETILLAERIAVTDLNVRVEKNNHYDFGGWRIFLDEIDRKNVKFTSDPAIEFFDSDMLPYSMTLRRWQAGDVFTPLGMKGRMNVSDFLTNSKITFFNRQHVLVLAAKQPEGEKLVWLCGLRLNDEFKVHPETRRVLRVEFRRPKLPMPTKEERNDELEN